MSVGFVKLLSKDNAVARRLIDGFGLALVFRLNSFGGFGSFYWWFNDFLIDGNARDG